MNHELTGMKCVCGEQSCGLCCTRIENLGVRIGNDTILKDINLHVHCGEFTAVIGPNGAGKSTLLKAILGEVRHTGHLKFMRSSGIRKERPVIGYVPQNLNLIPPVQPVCWIFMLFAAAEARYGFIFLIGLKKKPGNAFPGQRPIICCIKGWAPFPEANFRGYCCPWHWIRYLSCSFWMSRCRVLIKTGWKCFMTCFQT